MGTSNSAGRGRVLVACLLLGGGLADDVAGQPLDLKHSWVRTTGVSIQEDAAKGVAVWHEGTVMSIAERGANGSLAQRRARVAFTPPGNPGQEIEVFFMPTTTNPEHEVLPRGLAGGSPPVEARLEFTPSFEPTAYTTGFFSGEANFVVSMPTADSTSNAWTVKVWRDSGVMDVKWLTRFRGPGEVRGLAIAAGPDCPGDTTPPTSNSTRGSGSQNNSLLTQPFPPEPSCPGPMSFVAAAGSFKGVATFRESPAVTRTSIGGTDDGYVALLAPENGALVITQSPFLEPCVVTVCGTGADRITAVAVDQRDQSVVIGGVFSDDELLFKWNNHTVTYTITSHAGGEDGFVARLVWDDQSRLVPEWVYAFGGTGDDGVGGVALDARGNVYATGWMKATGGTRDLWVCQLPFYSPGGGPFNAPGWEFVYAGTGDDAGLGVAVDGLDRPVFTGQFGLVGTTNQYTLDFNPSQTQADNRMTAGGTDIFLLRFVPWGAYDGALVFGANKDDAGTAVGIDPADTARFAHAGSFGSPDATGTYVVDFDPGSGGNTNTATSGKGDAFVNSLTPLFPETLRRIQISLVLDNSPSVTTLNYEKLIRALNTAIGVADTMPTDTSVAINAVMYPFIGRSALAGSAMPWTVVDSETAELFRLRLFNLVRPIGHQGGSGDNYMDEGLNLAVSRLQTATVEGLDAFYRHVFIIADEFNSEPGAPLTFEVIDAARDAAIGSTLFDQVNCLAVDEGNFYPFNRDHAAFWVVESLVQVTGPALPAPEPPYTFEHRNLGYAAQTPHPTMGGQGYSDSTFAPLVNRMIRRMTVCPADYTHNGILFEPVDRQALIDDSTAIPPHPYADWNFDGRWDALPTTGTDRRKFEREVGAIGCGI